MASVPFTGGPGGALHGDEYRRPPGQISGTSSTMQHIPFATALGAAAMCADFLFPLAVQYRIEYLGDGIGEQVHDVPRAARKTKIMRADAAGAKARLAAVATQPATPAADDTTIDPVPARIWILWHERLRGGQY